MLVKIAKPFERKREKEDKETKILFFLLGKKIHFANCSTCAYFKMEFSEIKRNCFECENSI
jgi:hypothetical protein